MTSRPNLLHGGHGGHGGHGVPPTSPPVIQLGAARITRVQDFLGLGFPPAAMFPAITPEHLAAEMAWLAPGYYDSAAKQLRTSIHSWLVRTERHTILVDSCIGNHKTRPSIDRFHQRNEPWLDRLKAAGAAPEDIDFVMCTHLHADHVGWNTRLDATGRWVPTFPNARYLFSRRELARWDPRIHGHVPRPINENVFDDSILPVLEAGLVQEVDDGFDLDNLMRVEAAYGHTPGHVTIRLKSGTEEGLFSGDVIHHPIQVPHPTLCSVFDEDPALALQVRLAVLQDCAERDAWLFPAHFPEPHCCKIGEHGGKFSLRW